MRTSAFSPEQRRDIVIAMLSGRVPIAELAREHQVDPVTLYRWRDRFVDAGLKAFQGNDPAQREGNLERENAKLKELVGDLSLANYVLKGGRTASMRNNGGSGSA